MSLAIFRKALRCWRAQVMNLDNVVGVGLGRKHQQGYEMKKMAVAVLVKQKLPRDRLDSSQLVPKLLAEEVETDVIEVGDLTLLDLRTDRHRPAPGGVSIGHYRISAGTLGGLIRSRRDGSLWILSNNHVLANLSDGTDNRAAIGDPILQPSAYDGGSTSDPVAALARFVPLHKDTEAPACPIARAAEQIGTGLVRTVARSYQLRLYKAGPPNLVDAAAAKPLKESTVVPDILGLGRPTGTALPELSMTVAKSGRTSGVTTGKIRVVEATVRVSLPDGQSAMFQDQILTTPMASPGDSGSLGLTEDLRVVGLLCAGSSAATMFCRIDHVLEQLDAELVTADE